MADNALFTALLRLADDHLILGQRLSEWCGHGPTLEEDLALSNIALDLIGQSRAAYQYAAEVEGQSRDEDQLAFLRNQREYVNLRLCEMKNDDFAFTIFRQLAFGLTMRLFWEKAMSSSDAVLSAIAAKAVKESTYHVRHSAEWVIRLADGTDESRRRIIGAIENLTPYLGEMFESDEVTASLSGIWPDPQTLKAPWLSEMAAIFVQAGLELPEITLMQKGGRDGIHSEEMGFLLGELQFMQRTYPDMTW